MEFESVLGLDLSLTRTGMASVDLTSGAIATRALSTTRLGHNRLQYMLQSISLAMQTHDLIGIEAPPYGIHLKGSHDLAGFWWMVKHEAWRQRIPVVLVNAKTRAKYATGNGGSAKPAVHRAAQELWPDLELRTHDEGDGLLIAAITARVAGVPFDGQVSTDRYNKVNKMVVLYPS